MPVAETPARPRRRKGFGDWWRLAEHLAANAPDPEDRVVPQRRRGFHSLRRLFATELKEVPLKDLAELGGWRDLRTVAA